MTSTYVIEELAVCAASCCASAARGTGPDLVQGIGCSGRNLVAFVNVHAREPAGVFDNINLRRLDPARPNALTPA